MGAAKGRYESNVAEIFDVIRKYLDLWALYGNWDMGRCMLVLRGFGKGASCDVARDVNFWVHRYFLPTKGSGLFCAPLCASPTMFNLPTPLTTITSFETPLNTWNAGSYRFLMSLI